MRSGCRSRCGEGRGGSAAAGPMNFSGPRGWPTGLTRSVQNCPAASASGRRCAPPWPTGRRLLLADEPTGELDDASAEAVRALIVQLARTDGTSVILVTHDLATAEVADRIVRIRDGRIVGERTDGQESLVINGGWLQLPRDLLESSRYRAARPRAAPPRTG